MQQCMQGEGEKTERTAAPPTLVRVEQRSPVRHGQHVRLPVADVDDEPAVGPRRQQRRGQRGRQEEGGRLLIHYVRVIGIVDVRCE